MAWVGEPVTRVRREQTGIDRYGNPEYGDVQTVLPERAGFAPGGTSEPVEVGREPVITTPKLYFLRQYPDLRRDDRVIVRGRTYLVDGDQADWIDPFGSIVGGAVVELEAAEG